ncbi:hypothetical protein PCANC_08189 [Puccinia coronata f. sp. avenae]|uniref:Pre-mRNA-splicing factor CWC24 n=1 Tax=Puccinia coronata f. sp. avenae TaxID=200324 RepID=A0A2N5SGB3_9BASI|nr:hypothetical protein PCASD_19410 [Puccinia coronata f. sp. avenae]PLW50047.1 hypothetical protein PCANC_08189 [Puccinia coronata f. sp. avenae]
MSDNHQAQQATSSEHPLGQDVSEQVAGPSAGSLFKKRSKKTPLNQQIRKRTIDSEPLSTGTQDGNDKEAAENDTKKLKLARDQSAKQEQQQPVVKFSRRKNRRSHNPLYQATGGKTSRMKAGQSDISSSDGEESSEEDESKSRTVGVAYQAQGSARQQAEESYQKSLLEKRELGEKARQDLELDQSNPVEPPGPDPKIYLGTANSKYQLPKGSQKYGPIKGGPNNIKTITVVDYQPDVCKDYKETGYCGFGDTCKFLHDRGDYMHGWQLDDAFNSRTQKKVGGDDSESEEEVPFACLICRQPFADPIVTKCKHYFCAACAIKRFAKTPKCFACGTPTGGIFNKASRIIEKMNAKQERIKRQKEERRREEEGLAGIEGLETHEAPAGQELEDEGEGSERSFYEDE